MRESICAFFRWKVPAIACSKSNHLWLNKPVLACTDELSPSAGLMPITQVAVGLWSKAAPEAPRHCVLCSSLFWDAFDYCSSSLKSSSSYILAWWDTVLPPDCPGCCLNSPQMKKLPSFQCLSAATKPISHPNHLLTGIFIIRKAVLHK